MARRVACVCEGEMGTHVVLEPHSYGHMLHADVFRLIANADYNRRLMREASTRAAPRRRLGNSAPRLLVIHSSRAHSMSVYETQRHRYAV